MELENKKEKSFDEMTHEEQREYLKNLPIVEGGVKAEPFELDCSLEEFIEKNDYVKLDDVLNNIARKFDL